MSAVCESFHCTPEEANRQDWPTVRAVLDYRAAEMAVELFNSKDKAAAFDALRSNPQLTEVLAKMTRAQQGVALEGGDAQRDAMATAEAYRVEPPEDEDDEQTAGDYGSDSQTLPSPSRSRPDQL